MNGRRWRTSAVCLAPGLLVALGMCSVPTWRDALGACGAAWNAAQENGPRLALETTELNFGQVTAGRRLEARLTVYNQGNRRLIVHPDRESCDCTNNYEAAVIVEPGRSAELVVPLDTSTIAGTPRLVRHYTTNDPQQPRFAITLQATVVPNEETPPHPSSR